MTELELYQGDCREVMATWPPASIDAIVTDPPYEIGFMARGWDSAGVAFEAATWAAALRLLKPGGHLIAFGGPRTYHRLACAIEDAGFELRDCLMWIFGSGFPKSLNLHGEYEGWGTALKPAYEPIVLARKPLTGTVAGNVEAYGTGALNIAASRIGESKRVPGGAPSTAPNNVYGAASPRHEDESGRNPEIGRWPANVLLDEDAAVLLDSQSAGAGAFAPVRGSEPTSDGLSGPVYGEGNGTRVGPYYGDQGGASRFFYTAKASRTEREAWLEDVDPARRSDGREKDIENPRLRTNARRNDHPTVKPVDLMRWLCRLITPPGGLILDPFMGSGSTGMAALDVGFRFRGIDQDPHYVELSRRRIEGRHRFTAPPEPGPANKAPRLL